MEKTVVGRTSRIAAGTLLAVLAVALAWLFGAGTAQAQAAPKLSHGQMIITVGQSKILKVAGAKSKVSWSSSKKGIVGIKASGKNKATAKVTAKKAGSTTVRAKVGKRTLKAKAKVVNKAAVPQQDSQGENQSTDTPADSTTPQSPTEPTAPATPTEPSDQNTPTTPATPTGQGQTHEQESRTSTSKTLVVYWSATGNTQRVANIIAAHLNVTSYELQAAQPYTAEDVDYRVTTSRCWQEHTANLDNDTTSVYYRPALAESVPNWADYDIVYVGYPIWWAQAPNLLYTFVESHDFTGKTVIPFCTSMSSGLGTSATRLAAAAKGDGTWKAGQRFGEHASEESITAWVDSQR